MTYAMTSLPEGIYTSKHKENWLNILLKTATKCKHRSLDIAAQDREQTHLHPPP